MLNVLLVDDEQDFAELLAERLRTRGLMVRTAHDGYQALEAVREAVPDVVLLDLSMPGMSGMDTLEILKSTHPQVQVILLTADTAMSTAVAGMKRGACDYLTKPVELDALLTAVHESEGRRLETLSRQRMAEAAKLAALGELGKGVAHEINNPLNIMVNEAGWMQDVLDDAEVGPEVRKQLQESLALIQTQAGRCKTITAKLLTLRPVRNTRSALDSLPNIWAQVLEERQEQISAKMEVRTSWDADLGRASWAVSDWAQILGAMLDNALDALGSEAGRIDIAGEIRGDDLVLTMTDTGRGIEAHLLPRIFEPFFSTKDVGQGIGLGLSICHAMVEARGGRMSVRSAPDQGAAFTIETPVAGQ